MNRIAALLLFLMVAALAILLITRSTTGPSDILDQTNVRRHPEAALENVDTLLHRVRDGVTASEQARKLLNTIIDDRSDPESTLDARLRLVELEQSLGNHAAAGAALLDAIQAHPGSAAIPRLLIDLGLLLHGPLDRPAEAAEVLNKVVLLYPDHPLADEALLLADQVATELADHE